MARRSAASAAWRRACASKIPDAAEEALAASATVFTKGHFSAAGFAELDAPDLTALGRGQPILTHRARLPRAVVAYESLLSSPTASADERERYRAVLWALRRLPDFTDSEFAA